MTTPCTSPKYQFYIESDLFDELYELDPDNTIEDCIDLLGTTQLYVIATLQTDNIVPKDVYINVTVCLTSNEHEIQMHVSSTLANLGIN